MNINLQTDAKKHNLSLMKISAYHKLQGDRVYFRGVGSLIVVCTGSTRRLKRRGRIINEKNN